MGNKIMIDGVWQDADTATGSVLAGGSPRQIDSTLPNTPDDGGKRIDKIIKDNVNKALKHTDAKGRKVKEV